METSSVLLAISAGNSAVTGEFPAQRPVTRSFNIFFDFRLNERWSGWFETPLGPLWRHYNDSLRCAELFTGGPRMLQDNDFEMKFQWN